MTTRLREEVQEGNDPRTAADLAVEHAGPTVVSAGVILAGADLDAPAAPSAASPTPARPAPGATVY